MNSKQDAETYEDVAAEAEAAPADATASETGGAEGPAAEVERLEAELTELRNDVLRARAEADNTRKRAERDVEAAHKYGLERFVGELLPVKDSMDMGLSAAGTATDVATLREGMELTLKMLEDMFAKLGVRVVDPLGEPFDPEFHQAMTMEDSAEAAPGTVLRVMQKGYLLNDRLVRPALVVVARAAEGG